MSTIIEIQNLSKKYLINHDGPSCYSTLVETWSNKARAACDMILHPFSKKCRKNKSHEEFWALDNITFSIEEGDRVGIIGRNGAGKSTLLKILSRITEPTKGSVKIRGKVSSLLEVGTGFHPELTGRENIFLNGAILGMRRQEIRKKFDEIVAFGDIEKFLDTPVKRYSSGMHARLGFAIAAHLDPDLFIVDEVLAVGDIQFQEKCLKKLNDLSSYGRTILFVSHDIGSVMTLCNKAVYLENGKLKQFGSVESCVNEYSKTNRMRALLWQGSVGDEHIRFDKVYLETTDGNKEFFYQDEEVRFIVEYEVLIPSSDLILGVGIWNQRKQLLAHSYTSDDAVNFHYFNRKGKHKAAFTLNAGWFHEGEYLIKLDCVLHQRKHILDDHIILKFPIYPKMKNTRFNNSYEKDGVFLGNHWQQISYEQI